MENTEITNIHDPLRSWADGVLSDEAGVELLIRGYGGRFAARTQPWVRVAGETAAVDWAMIPEYVGGLSGGERRYLMLAASLAGGAEVNLDRTFASLDQAEQDLVLSALRHAGGRRVWARKAEAGPGGEST